MAEDRSRVKTLRENLAELFSMDGSKDGNASEEVKVKFHEAETAFTSLQE